MSTWKKTKVSEFLFEREEKFKPSSEQLAGLKRIEKIDFQGTFHVASKPSKTNMILVHSGDLVISGINVSKGALGIYEGTEPVTATIHYSSYTFDESQIHIDYLKRFLKSPKFVELLKEQVRGGIKTEIKPRHILALEIALPSIPEQKIIIDQFKRIETEDRELKAEISHQKAILKKLSQQMLQDAVEGKHTASWRRDNPDVEPASELLNRISTEKEKLVRDKQIRKQKLISPISENEAPFSIPKGWEWCRLDQVILESPRNGYSPKAVDFKTNTKTLKLGATTKGVFDPREYKYINKEIDRESHLWLTNGDILIQRSNSLDHVGISAIYDAGDSEFIYPDIMMKIKAATGIEVAFLHRVLTSPFCREYFRSSATGAQKSMPKINQGVVSSTLIPLPPKLEQIEITARTERLFRICEQLQAQVAKNEEHVNQFMHAVLLEIFSQKSVKHQSTDNVVEQNSSKTKKVDYYRRTLLAAEIVDQLQNEPTLGHLKLQKLIFLCQKTQNMKLPTNFLQQAAGPYDPKMARSIDKQLREKKWFEYKKNELHKYRPLDDAGSHKTDFHKYFSNDLSAISRIIDLFRKARSEEMEAVATLYACWEELLQSEADISNDLLTTRFYAWSEQKSRFPVDKLEKTIAWMIDHDVCPASVQKV